MKVVSLKKAKDKAWVPFSKYIRLKGAKNEINKCVTCKVVRHYKELQAGHFIQGRRNAVLFDERNVHPQCYACNMYKSGNLIKYYRFMLKTYGQKVIDELERKNEEVVKYKVWDFERIEQEYKDKLKKL